MGGVLALDVATTTGWAWAEPGGVPEWGHKLLGTPGTTAGALGAALTVMIEARIELYRPDWIIYEAPYVPRPSHNKKVPLINPQTLRRLLGLTFLVDTIAYQHGIECREATAMAVACYFVGRGKFDSPGEKKRETIERCRLMGWKATSDEADALALLCFAEARLFLSGSRKRWAERPAGPLFDQAASEKDLRMVG